MRRFHGTSVAAQALDGQIAVAGVVFGPLGNAAVALGLFLVMLGIIAARRVRHANAARGGRGTAAPGRAESSSDRTRAR